MIKTQCLRLLWIIMFSLGFIEASYSLQVKPITENAEANADVAIHDLTRIAVDGDRVVHVRGLEGAYQLKQDAAQGAFFIRPTLDDPNKPFTLFIATEQNHNYVLHLTPKDQWGDTIILKPKAPQKAKAYRLKKHHLQPKMTHLMTQMITKTVPPGYVVHSFTHSKEYKVNGDLTANLIRLYSSHPLRGYVYRITNHSRRTWVLTEAAFYQVGDRAIALSQLTVLPGSHITLYKVRRYE